MILWKREKEKRKSISLEKLFAYGQHYHNQESNFVFPFVTRIYGREKQNNISLIYLKKKFLF